MKQEALKAFTDTQLTAAGLVIFFCFFVGVLLWVNRKGSKNFYNKMGNLPLNEGEN
jgi:cbb3-type cytochrome oxidase subunit 3